MKYILLLFLLSSCVSKNIVYSKGNLIVPKGFVVVKMTHEDSVLLDSFK